MNKKLFMHAKVEKIRSLASRHATVDGPSIHGPLHWAQVEANGLRIASHIGADPTVVTLFAILHDSQRQNDGHDSGHGQRAAELIIRMGAEFGFLSDGQIKQLCHACRWHTHEKHNTDLTIGACYDADRLDLGRVGIAPDPSFLNSDFAKQMI